MARVELQNISKVFANGVRAVDDFSLSISDGEFIVLVGPSGCGKSTLLRLIAGLEEATSGSIRIADRLVNGIEPKKRDVAMVFQNFALYPHLTVFENLAFPLKLRKTSKPEIQNRVNEVAASLGIEALLARRPHELSGGQQQRVALGRAAVRRPAVFLFDEPLSNLDAQLRSQMRAEIRRLHQGLGCTMLYVTHDQLEAMTMGDRIVVLKEGLIQQVAEASTLYDQPASSFVGQFIGSPSMNQITGKIDRSDRGIVFRSKKFEIPISTNQDCNKRMLGKVVILGIRPHDLSIGVDSSDEICSTIELIEPTGADTFLHLDIECDEGHRMVARVDPGARFELGQKVFISLGDGRVHLFDAETKLAIRNP